jgi:hypothetical protein
MGTTVKRMAMVYPWFKGVHITPILSAHIITILLACNSLVEFYFDIGTGQNAKDDLEFSLPPESLGHVTRLGLGWMSFLAFPSGYHAICTVTHLDLLGTINTWNDEESPWTALCEALVSMPNLSHLALRRSDHADILVEDFADITRIRRVVFWMELVPSFHMIEAQNAQDQRDMRFWWLGLHDYDHYLREHPGWWWDGYDVWAAAEEIHANMEVRT